MTVTFVLAALLLGYLLGRLRSRRRYNAGVAAGAEQTLREHGWHCDPNLAAPKRRLWRSLDRQADTPAPSYAPWVTSNR